MIHTSLIFIIIPKHTCRIQSYESVIFSESKINTYQQFFLKSNNIIIYKTSKELKLESELFLSNLQFPMKAYCIVLYHIIIWVTLYFKVWFSLLTNH